MNEHYEQWSRLSGIGMLLIGMGASIIGHATWIKSTKRGIWGWVFWGVIGLAVMNAGIAIFGESVKHRTLYETQLEQLMK